jgi:Ser/Thr protein kinase RdoA (MazF antagonist)
MSDTLETALADFSHLTPDLILRLVETALGERCSNVCRPYASYINRVYEVGLARGEPVVAKFYRPGRWSRAALEDEQEFVSELAAAEISVVPPRPGTGGRLLHEHEGMCFAIFPKRGGRTLDEPTDDDWRQIGRLIARLHVVGARRAPRDRAVIHPRRSSEGHLRFVLDARVLPDALRARYERAARDLLDRVAPLFDGAEDIRLHGDCHRANILHRPGEPFHLIDFDDMGVGPPVQDLWMLLPGHLRESAHALGLLLDGYETFRPFDRASLRLIEPLRFMRFLHYTAWCARQKADGGFARLAPDWGTPGFWRAEMDEFDKQGREIEDALSSPLPPV